MFCYRLGVLGLMYGLVASTALADVPAGQKVFTEHKCQQCHEVTKLGIKSTGGKDEKITDLTGVGKQPKDWLEKFMLKKADKKGEKHKKKFRGDAKTELAPLVDWLSTL